MGSRVLKHLRPTPMKAHYTFNWTDLSKILFTMQMVDFRSMNTLTQVMTLLYHECLRTYGDRILMKHDKEWFLENLEEICRNNFNVLDESTPECKELRSKLSEEEFKSHLAKTE
jgi:dynein heavy chain